MDTPVEPKQPIYLTAIDDLSVSALADHTLDNLKDVQDRLKSTLLANQHRLEKVAVAIDIVTNSCPQTGSPHANGEERHVGG